MCARFLYRQGNRPHAQRIALSPSWLSPPDPATIRPSLEVTITRDRRAYPPSGQMIEVHCRRLHLVIMGQEKGMPTLLLAQGMGSFSSSSIAVK